MKQKYVVMLDSENNSLVIKEYAELDKEMLSLLCEETYSLESIETAKKRNRGALIQALRTQNMYPPASYTEEIADAVASLFEPGANPSTELFFEDKDLFIPEEEPEEEPEESDDDDSGLNMDDLLDEDEIEDDFENKGIPKNLKMSNEDENSDSA